MTIKKQEIIYPEMLEYAWVKDLDRVMENSKYVKQDYSGEPVIAHKLPKTPINLVLAVMKEAMSYPEVMAAYGSAPLDGQIPPREQYLLMRFNEYLVHKYGNIPNVTMVTTIPMIQLALGVYTSLEDSNLKDDLLRSPFVIEDDGKDYEQPLAGDIRNLN